MKLIFTLLLATIAFNLKGQHPSTDPKVAMLYKFYTAYITECSSSNDKAELNLLLLRKKYCTSNFLKQYQKLVVETDADPLINAQDSDKDFLKSLTIKKNLKRADQYVVSYGNSIEMVNINLKVITQDGVPKISSIE
ncbi:hypothetical protein [Mucilaginibacter defluvii]|uniref:Uncharacterized protein n=1 Tax=Mucilaginibacter defluvii TaxID=1196019 RepID=A0ABP9GDS9_9SPHI